MKTIKEVNYWTIVNHFFSVNFDMIEKINKAHSSCNDKFVTIQYILNTIRSKLVLRQTHSGNWMKILNSIQITRCEGRQNRNLMDSFNVKSPFYMLKNTYRLRERDIYTNICFIIIRLLSLLVCLIFVSYLGHLFESIYFSLKKNVNGRWLDINQIFHLWIAFENAK